MDTPVTITGDDVGVAEQTIRYELTTLAFRLPDATSAKTGIEAWLDAPDAHGQLLGSWEAEHGILGRVYVLREFENDAELAAERMRAAHSTRPFGAGDHLTDLTMNGYAPFPFMPRVATGAFGSVYEIRDYRLIPGGLPATIDGWRIKLPGRHLIDPIAVVMYALDGPARIIHIWPFSGLDERVAVRRRLVEEGNWPPPGGPEHILEATSTMAWPLPGSPLH
jgi:NIPSNAP